MKILVVQLARLGDILMTWPQIRALKRLHPESQIDLLLRPRFKDAAARLNEINEIIEFPVENIFEPLLGEPLHFNESLDALNEIIQTLRNKNYDWIVNSTLSPASSYLTYELKNQTNRITGYTRTSDGYLSIPDDVSAYIYAQVGIDRNNRVHLSDLFTLMIGGQPSMDDWKTQIEEASPVSFPRYIVVHVGASQEDKKLSPFKWRTFLNHFHKTHKTPIVLIGNEAEQKDADFVALGLPQDLVLNLTGQLKFNQLFPLIKNAQLYLGADSAPLHIASLVGTPALNVSLNAVNFWETGPKSKGSRVLYAQTEAELPSEKMALEAIDMLNAIELSSTTIASKEMPKDAITFIEGSPSYQAPANTRNSDWTWSLIKALYMEGEWPSFVQGTQYQGVKNLREVNDVMLEQIRLLKTTQNVSTVTAILQRCEEVIDNVGRLVPEITPLIRWYQTQKALIPPLTPRQVLEATEKVHTDLESLLLYWLNTHELQKDQSDQSDKSTLSPVMED